MKGQQAIVKGQLGKGKGHMASVEEDGMPHIIRDRMEVDYQFPQDTGTHQAPVIPTPNISNVLLEERGESSSGERGPVCNLGVFEGTETIDTTGPAMGSENHEHVQVEGDGEGHALEVENEEWGWSRLFCLLRDFPEFRPPDFPHRPWKHTREECDVVCKFLNYHKAHRTIRLRPPLIVLALKATWHFHFGYGSSMIEHYPKLVEKPEHVSQDKEFVNNLSRMQHLMRMESGSMTGYAKILFVTIQDHYEDDEQPTLEDDVSSFKATSEIREIGMWAFSSGARRNDQQAFPVGDDIEELGIGVPERFVRHFDTRQATGTLVYHKLVPPRPVQTQVEILRSLASYRPQLQVLSEIWTDASLGNQKASLDESEPVKTYCLLAVLEQTEEALEAVQRISRILLDPNY
ncbi:unnamed protein product [Sphagnum troendelagicum]|uniref:Uncharacterized protein n=1 Tax=Sphagnum troendelagicum TaxID=128251 RepID=A0ABP0UAP5_9BRYO